jgi:hypothetical protein
MNENIMVPADRVLDLVQLTSEISKRAADMLGQQRTTTAKVASLRPQVLDAMLKSGAVTPNQATAADRALSDHGSALALLKNACIEIGKQKQAKSAQDNGSLGQPEGGTALTKSASAGSYRFVGQETGQRTNADRVFFERLNIAVPE